MKVSYHDQVVVDLDEGWSFYERQDPGVGDYFVGSILADAESLATTGGTHRKTFGCHRFLGTTFPFAIYYRLESDQVRVLAILDLRRDPTWLREELGQRT